VATVSNYILALDLGTTGNRAILFDREGNVVGQAYQELTQHYPQPGWLEHDAEEIWQGTYGCIKNVISKAQIQASEIAAIGLTVQRETCLLWDKNTGNPLHKAIVWQDRRTAEMCDRLKQEGKAPLVQQKTGLILDAYFSATKLAWLIDWVKQNKANTNWDNVIAGTVDSWALWKLTGGKVHATDNSNASRTMLMNLDTGDWDAELLKLFNIPANIMPKIQPSLGVFGTTDPELLGAEIPITAIFGDQQAALFAHGCDRPGLNHQLLSTVAWSDSKKTNYALEGAIFTSGACIQWLRDGIGLITEAAETETLAASVDSSNGVYFVPALSGLGAPHWNMNARGAFLGITGGVNKAHLVRAVLEAIAYQVKEVVEAVNKDLPQPVSMLKVDGGVTRNNFLMQFQADALGIPVERPKILDATAQGAAFGAGLTIGFWQDYQKLINNREIDRVFEPGAGKQTAQENFLPWSQAVARVL